MKILIVDDLITNISVLRIALTKAGHTVAAVRDGREAIVVLKDEKMDVVVTDWMMPNLDGLALLRWIRQASGLNPAVVVITALASADAQSQALEAGADCFLTKPVLPAKIVSIVAELELKRNLRVEARPASAVGVRTQLPNYCPIAFGAGTGGAQAIRRIFKAIDDVSNAAVFIVLHGPGWAAEALAEQMRMQQFAAPIVIPQSGETIVAGTIYIAPGDRHMLLSMRGTSLELAQTEPENFHRPSIDPLFRSMADVFGRRALGVVLTGTGIDGYIGAGHIRAANGTVIVQEPNEAVSSQMSQNVITLGLATRVLPLEQIASALREQIEAFHRSRPSAALMYSVGSAE